MSKAFYRIECVCDIQFCNVSFRFRTNCNSWKMVFSRLAMSFRWSTFVLDFHSTSQEYDKWKSHRNTQIAQMLRSTKFCRIFFLDFYKYRYRIFNKLSKIPNGIVTFQSNVASVQWNIEPRGLCCSSKILGKSLAQPE